MCGCGLGRIQNGGRKGLKKKELSRNWKGMVAGNSSKKGSIGGKWGVKLAEKRKGRFLYQI